MVITKKEIEKDRKKRKNSFVILSCFRIAEVSKNLRWFFLTRYARFNIKNSEPIS